MTGVEGLFIIRLGSPSPSLNSSLFIPKATNIICILRTLWCIFLFLTSPLSLRLMSTAHVMISSNISLASQTSHLPNWAYNSFNLPPLIPHYMLFFPKHPIFRVHVPSCSTISYELTLISPLAPSLLTFILNPPARPLDSCSKCI